MPPPAPVRPMTIPMAMPSRLAVSICISRKAEWVRWLRESPFSPFIITFKYKYISYNNIRPDLG
jgi:hypothetical protein